MEELVKLDTIRERLDVSYQEAREALEHANGDVVEAIVWLEGKGEAGEEELLAEDPGREWRFKHWVQKGLTTKIRVKRRDQTVTEVPAVVGAAGVAGMVASPFLALVVGLGSVAAMMGDYSLELKTPEDGEDPDREPS